MIGSTNDLRVGRRAFHTVAQMRPVADGKVLLQGLDANSEAGRDALKQFSIEHLPAYVFADSKGRVVEKIEGRINAADMRAKLNALAKGR